MLVLSTRSYISNRLSLIDRTSSLYEEDCVRECWIQRRLIRRRDRAISGHIIID
jgi:hypothetical protein